MRYDTKEAPGTIIIDPRNYFVYRIEGDGNATRYGANVGRAGFLWSGEAYVGRKAEWPIWTPPKEMILRQPEARKYAGGMPPGLENPLGARVLYLYKNGVYTVFTIYSTSDPETIGDRRYERLYRPPQSGHDRPLFTNADQDEGGHAADIANGVNLRCCGSQETVAEVGKPPCADELALLRRQPAVASPVEKIHS